MNKINVVYVVPYLINSGPINVVYNIVKYLDKDMYCVTLVSLIKNKCPQKNNKGLFDELNVAVIEYSYSNLYLQFHLSSIARELEVRFNKPNTVFHAHGYYPTLILSKMKKCLTMNTIHNICDEDFKMDKGSFMGSYMSYTYKRSLKNINLCVPISDYMKSFYALDKSLVLRSVYNGVEIVNPYFSIEEKSVMRREMGISPTSKVFLYPAVFSDRKNQKEIIEAVKSSLNNDIVVLFAGHGVTENECKQLVGGDKRFRFLGFHMDLSKYWCVSDYLISSSKSEGLPMAVLEALVRGLPCFLSDIPPHKELIFNIFNTTDLCYRLGDVQDFKFKLDKFLSMAYNSCDIQSKARKLYSSEVMSSHYAELYNELILKK